MNEAIQPEVIPAPAAATGPKKFNWLLFIVLCVVGFLASFLVLPYAVALTSPDSLGLPGADQSMVWVMSIVGQICTGAFLWPLIALGLLAANQIGMGAPLLEGLLTSQPLKGKVAKPLLWGFAGGSLAGVGIVLLSFAANPLLMAESERLGQSLPEIAAPAPWMGFLASISAGITEEIMLRLFLLTGLAWLGSRLWRTPEGRARRSIFWSANLLSAIAFGLLHLPLASSLEMTTPLMTLYVVSQNALLGLTFGWLYDKYGLESAMLAHFSTDLVLHVFLPMLPLAAA
ncbi:MAG: CPBP family intramembrane metalloprotease [Anaerolineales bacterium]|nr:CPBP family intramembrane metalloprotease [Anaerolineales bacterium]